MKKTAILCTVFFVLGAVLLFAVSYDNNEYQRKSRAYSELARRAYSEGNYDASIEYSRLAEENAQKSADYIQYMLARVEAEQAMNRARTRYTWAKNNKAEEKYPEAIPHLGIKTLMLRLSVRKKFWMRLLWLRVMNLRLQPFRLNTVSAHGAANGIVYGILRKIRLFMTIHICGENCMKQTRINCLTPITLIGLSPVLF